MTDSSQYTVVIGANDPFLRSFIEQCVSEHPWFVSLSSASTALQAANAAISARPDVVVLVDESPGLRGRDVLPDIEAALSAGHVILMSTADLVSLRALPAVAAAVPHRDHTALFDALTAFGQWMSEPTEFGTDRRTTGDRRVYQNWAKTFAQRRASARRAGELTSA